MPYKVYPTNGKNLTKGPLNNWIHDYIVLDVETTGTDPKNNEIIEVGASHYINGNEVSAFQSLVKPKKRYSANEILEPFITNLTNITDEMIHDAEEQENIIPAFKEYIADHVIIGHNIPFDLNFLDEKFKEYCNASCNNDYVDTLDIAHQCYILKNYQLPTIAEEFNIENENAHRALNDARTEYKVLQYMIPTYIETNPDINQQELDYPYTLI